MTINVSLPIGTAVDTGLGLGFIVGHVIDPDDNIKAYLVTFDYWTPGNIRPDQITPAVGWLFNVEDIKLVSGVNKHVN